MPFPLFNSIASWFLKKRIHQIELFLKYPVEVQQEVLMDLISFAKNTKIGYQYDFNSIKNYTEFKERVPIRSYEEIAEDINKSREGEDNLFWPTKIKWYAKSSGTTDSRSKFIPVSTEALEDCHYKAGKDMLSLYINNNTNTQLFTGKCLRLGGSQELHQNQQNYFGDLSSIIIDNMPLWAEINSTPSMKVSLMSDWDSKIKAILNECLSENVTSLVGVPSWMLVLLNQGLSKMNKSDIFEIWPNVEVYFHGGVSFRPYKNQYNQIFSSSPIHYYEIYNASEGFFAIQDLNDSDQLLLMLDYGIFYEFIPIGENLDSIVDIQNVKLFVEYEMVITTNGGLWRYRIGDVVRFTSLSPFRIQITGRTKHFINAFGEEVVIENTDKAIEEASIQTGVKIVDYTVAPIYISKNNSRGSHQWLIEFKDKPSNLDKFAKMLDQKLRQLNSDYDAKRYKDITMSSPKISIAQKGLFDKWLRNYNKIGGQHKIQRLSNDRKFIENLLSIEL